MCFPQFQILCLTFLNAALIAAFNGGRPNLLLAELKPMDGSRAGVNLGLANQGPIRYIFDTVMAVLVAI